MEKQGKTVEGLLLVNKPSGITSHDVVDCVRKKLHIRRVGHAGTLDPLAEGLLVILVGKYTKFFSRFAAFDKEYKGVMKLGETTTTGDAQGSIVKKDAYTHITESQIHTAVASFRGTIEQIPPMVSAIRVEGKRLYKLARKGITVKRPPRKITIYKLDVTAIDLPLIEFYVKCSKGTYIRKLAEDIGERLGCGAHMTKIIRTAIGPFTLDEAVELCDVDETHLKKITVW